MTWISIFPLAVVFLLVVVSPSASVPAPQVSTSIGTEWASCRWVGTSPACQAGCEAGEQEVERSSTGDGAACWTGYKTKCCTPAVTAGHKIGAAVGIPTSVTCRWVGTAPACQAGCEAGENEVERSSTGGGGAACWTGYKTKCCKTIGG